MSNIQHAECADAFTWLSPRREERSKTARSAACKVQHPRNQCMPKRQPKAGIRRAARRSIFPPPPRGMKGRAAELGTLARTVLATRPTRIALVGPGGSGKSMLATALGHKLRAAFGGRVDWFRSASWGFYTLSEMLALRFGTGRGDGRVKRLQRFLARGPQRRRSRD